MDLKRLKTEAVVDTFFFPRSNEPDRRQSLPFEVSKSMGAQSKPAAMICRSFAHNRERKGRVLVGIFKTVWLPSALGYATLMAESWPAKAMASPEGENATVWTHPPRPPVNSPHTVLKGSLSPHTVGAGLH